MKRNYLKDVLIIAMLLLSTIVNAQWTQLGLDIDGEVGHDQSGRSVSISADGSVVAIGAPYNDGNGNYAGHVRIYKYIFGTWTQIGNDIDGEASGDNLGHSVSLSADGSIVAIGAPYNDGQYGNDIDAGHVRIYKNISGTWTQIGNDIDGESSGDASGVSVSLSSDGSIVGIGAIENDGQNGNDIDAGHVRIYRDSSSIWVQVGNDIDGVSAGDYTGISVSLNADGTVVAIGAHGNDGNGIDAGHVRIYKNILGTWTQIGRDINGEAAGDNSGNSVSLSSDGSVVAIGAYRNSGNIIFLSGHVRIYKDVSGMWTQVGSDIDGHIMNGNTGYSVGLNADGSIVAVGTIAFFTSAGSVRVYKDSSNTWTLIGSKILGEGVDDACGSSVCLNDDGSFVAIGSKNNSIGGTQGYAGHVRIFSNPSVGVDEISNSVEVGVYPNPTKGKITIECEGMERVEVLDVAGKLVYEIAVSSDVLDIDISGFSKGVYFVKVSSGDGVGVERVVLE